MDFVGKTDEHPKFSTKEYIVFMTTPDFLDYLGVKCDSCG